ncbi:MAG: hypothetical protein K2P74_01655 [Nitrosomonas sp.]|nr:hypothetical protein [Nitrosomonas sp.]
MSLYELDKSTVVSRLHRWGAWKMRSGVALGYPAMSAFMNLSGRATTLEHIADEIDSECRQTNDAFEKLYFFPRSAIYVEYVIGVGKSRDEKACLCGCQRTAYYKYLESGHIEFSRILNLMLHSADKTDINLLNVSKVRLA